MNISYIVKRFYLVKLHVIITHYSVASLTQNLSWPASQVPALVRNQPSNVYGLVKTINTQISNLRTTGISATFTYIYMHAVLGTL